MKFPNPASRYAMVGVFVAKTAGGVRVAVTGAGPSVFRVKADGGCAGQELLLGRDQGHQDFRPMASTATSMAAPNIAPISWA